MIDDVKPQWDHADKIFDVNYDTTIDPIGIPKKYNFCIIVIVSYFTSYKLPYT